jgi:hypothetical protein
MVEKGDAAKGDANRIEQSGVQPGFQLGFRPAQVASGFWVIAALNPRNPSRVGPLIPTCKIGISL